MNKKRIHLFVPEDLYKQVITKLVQDTGKVNVTGLIIRLLQQYIKEQ
jgi:hypothetical protein